MHLFYTFSGPFGYFGGTTKAKPVAFWPIVPLAFWRPGALARHRVSMCRPKPQKRHALTHRSGGSIGVRCASVLPRCFRLPEKFIGNEVSPPRGSAHHGLFPGLTVPLAGSIAVEGKVLVCDTRICEFRNATMATLQSNFGNFQPC